MRCPRANQGAINGEVLIREQACTVSRDQNLAKQTLDGTLIRAWASHKSLVPRDGSDAPPKSGSKSNPDVDFKGTTRRNNTHVSTSDPDAMLATKGKGLAYEVA